MTTHETNPVRASGSAAVAVALALFAGFTAPAQASSHREAPFITAQPKVDGTDFYMFRSYETGRDGYVTFVANYHPLQDAYGGPNYFNLDRNAVYEIHVNNDGSGKKNLTFQFQSQLKLYNNQLNVGGKLVSIPLIINGSADINSLDSSALNLREQFTLKMIRNGDAATAKSVTEAGTGKSLFDKPVDNIGQKSIKDYGAYAAKHVYSINIPDCSTPGRVFVGQRKDPFVVNLGETFDLINYKAPAVEFDANAERSAKDSLYDKNVTSFVLEVPITCLTNGSEPVIGGWTTASQPQVRTLTAPGAGFMAGAFDVSGAQMQVSRLGAPLVNELVIGLKDKDRFNASEPIDDAKNFADYVTNPTLPALVEVLFGSAGVKAPTNFPRNDLITAFLTGVSGLNQPKNVVASEMLRLNTTTPVTAKGQQNRLGVIGGDNAGFPNGRRPGDDVVDIALRVVMGKLCRLNIGCTPADAPSGDIRFTDGAYVDDSYFDAAFPYLKTPIAGSPNR